MEADFLSLQRSYSYNIIIVCGAGVEVLIEYKTSYNMIIGDAVSDLQEQ